MQYNHSPISVREGHVFLDGVEIMDGVKFELKFTPDIWTGRQLGERSPSSRWIGHSISGDITRRRTTKWLEEKIKYYIRTGITPELTIQGIADDANSDFYAVYGAATVTAVGCVLTGDLNLMALDSGGDVLEDSIPFNAKDVIFG